MTAPELISKHHQPFEVLFVILFSKKAVFLGVLKLSQETKSTFIMHQGTSFCMICSCQIQDNNLGDYLDNPHL
jgi:hypothetical protein